jgi:hypothetical protein
MVSVPKHEVAVSHSADTAAVSLPTANLIVGELAQGRGVRHSHAPVVYLDPAASFEAAQGGVDPLPGSSDLMGEFFLAQIEVDGSVIVSGLMKKSAAMMRRPRFRGRERSPN